MLFQRSTQQLEGLARLARVLVLESTTHAGSGHPTSCLSATDLMVGLLFGRSFHAFLSKPRDPHNDRLIFSKGHAAPLLYAIYALAGAYNPKALLTLRKFGSDLEGHPVTSFPYTEVPTGSLGQGLANGVGFALHAKLHHLPFRTFVLLGDSEIAEGSVWEAIAFAGFRKLDNLVGVLDCSRLGQSGKTMLGRNTKAYAKRFRAFRWNTITVDGHRMNSILAAYNRALRSKHKPTMIIAETIKGRGVSFLENKDGWHGKALSKQELQRAIQELGPVQRSLRGHLAEPFEHPITIETTQKAKPPKYAVAKAISPRKAFGNALVRLAKAFPHMVVLDGEVKNSTFTQDFAKKFPHRFFEMYIAEQLMVSASAGLARAGSVPVSATFAAFFTRAFDQLRMAQYDGTHQIFVGTHAGVSVGADGASQMGLEDIAMFRSLQNSTILYPSDAYATERMLEIALRQKGLVYLRLTRGELPVLYNQKTKFAPGGSTTLHSSKNDQATIVTAGVTLHEALKAHAELQTQGIAVRVIDLYSIQPIDVQALRTAAKETKHVLVVEDHRAAGGIADAARTALGVYAGVVSSLAVTKTPHSGTPEQLLGYEGIDTDAIIREVRKVCKVGKV